MRQLPATLCLALIIIACGMSRAAEPDTLSLADAVKTFNDRAADDPVGKDQPPLTQDAVIAAVRWSLLDKDKLPVSAKTLQTLSRIVESRELPEGFKLEKLTAYEPNDQVTFTVWSVRLRIPCEPHGTTCIDIQEKMISSRLFGEQERRVIQKWQKKWQEQGGIASFDRPVYDRERAKAAEIDRAKQK
ncbi:MAG: hypothetical protein NTU53_23225 [Planctomycetota bacterium]|nr:hypothetical protein [Planctomycetota bacterium]